MPIKDPVVIFLSLIFVALSGLLWLFQYSVLGLYQLGLVGAVLSMWHVIAFALFTVYVDYRRSQTFLKWKRKAKGIRREHLVILIVAIIPLTVIPISAYYKILRIQTDFNNYVEFHHYIDSDYEEMLRLENALLHPTPTANLSYVVDYAAKDIQFYGVVCNHAYYDACHFSIGVIGYGIVRNTTVSLFYKTIDLGEMGPQDFKIVNTHLNYSSSPYSAELTSWKIQPGWFYNP